MVSTFQIKLAQFYNSIFQGLEAYFAGGYEYDSAGGSRILLDTIDIFALNTETWRTASESEHMT